MICPALERTVAASAYGRSVPVSQGHGEHHEQHHRLGDAPRTYLPGSKPSCAYGLPVSSAAVATTKLASDSRNPPPRMSPMYPQGQAELVSTGISSGTRSGRPATAIKRRGAGRTSSAPSGGQRLLDGRAWPGRSTAGASGGPRRPCSRRLHLAITPVTPGARSATVSTCRSWMTGTRAALTARPMIYGGGILGYAVPAGLPWDASYPGVTDRGRSHQPGSAVLVLAGRLRRASSPRSLWLTRLAVRNRQAEWFGGSPGPFVSRGGHEQVLAGGHVQPVSPAGEERAF